MIERSSVFHRPTDQYAYPFQLDKLHLRIQTKRSNVQAVELFHGDQYEWKENEWVTSRISLICTGSDELYDYWLCEVTPPYKRIRYGFVLHGNDEKVFYTEKGFFSEPPQDPSNYFCFPFLHKNELFRAPEWVQKTVWYQIFPERFSNGDEKLNPPNTKGWGAENPSPDNFFGGDFQGILDRLNYLEFLGITGIYLTPIFKAYSNHKYDTIDYFEIDPQFGDKKLFKKLVDKCHEKGIRVMLDAVFNHSGYYFPPFQSVLQKGEKSFYKNWFHTSEFPLRGGERPNYATFSFVESMPKLNTQDEGVKKYLLEVGRYWVREFDIDGWRLDVANEIDHQFWRDFRAAVKEIKPDLYILGEIWHDSMAWLRGDQFDSVMNYPFLTNTLNFFAKGILSPQEFIYKMTSVIHLYPDTVNEGLFNLVGSHDTPRLLTECGENSDKAKLIYTFLLTFTGTPCIYYGDEIGLTGGMDPGCRKCMDWEEEKHNKAIFNHIQKLIKLRKEVPLLANKGTIRFLEADKAVAYLKSDADQRCLIIINPSNEEIKYTLPFSLKGKKITELLKSEEYMLEAEKLIAIVPPLEAKILQFCD